jgi:predicted ATPase
MEAEAFFLKAIEVARQQSAKSLELRASTSLARLWYKLGKQDEARTMLAEIYNWFTEGDTADHSLSSPSPQVGRGRFARTIFRT